MSEPLSHDKLAATLAEGYMRETGCDRETAEIFADREMGAMHDGETCPVCLTGVQLPAVEKFEDLTPDEQMLCYKILDELSSITYYPANAGSDEQIVQAVREYYRLRCELITSVNERSSKSWHVDELHPLLEGAREMRMQMCEEEARVERMYGF